MASFKVYINGKEVIDGQTLPLQYAQTKPTFKFDRKNGERYTVIMVDPDAPYPDNPKYKYWLHWIVVNNDQEFIPFNPPTPPQDSNNHRYFFFLLKQKLIFEPKLEPLPGRKNFNLTNFITEHDMDDIASVYFKTGHQ